jgi:hypothetical protein
MGSGTDYRDLHANPINQETTKQKINQKAMLSEFRTKNTEHSNIRADYTDKPKSSSD